jgi:ribonuclease D
MQAAPSVLVFGGADVDVIRNRHRELNFCDKLSNFQSITHLHGLSDLVEKRLGKPLEKVMQQSDWKTRPLSQDQMAYAALDAWVLPQILANTPV